jgi:hypothetical protein
MAHGPPAPRLRIREIRLYERGVRFRMPFRFGIVTLTAAPQVFARVRIALETGREGWGAAAEMLAPKWFDKDVALTNEQNFEQLRTSLRMAGSLYTADRKLRTAWTLFAENHRTQVARCAAQGLNPLVAGFGPALLDRSVLDALCRVHEVSFYDAVRLNLPGIQPADLVPELAGYDFDRFLRGLSPAPSLHARHTVGLVDPITAVDGGESARVGDGLPETLEDVVAAYQPSYFKLKVGGKIAQDIDRLRAIASVLDRRPEPYHLTLDGNEQYHDVEGVVELWRAMERTPGLRRLVASILFIEQPISRKTALEQDVTGLGANCPVIIDESDADLDAFPRARACGYRGVSSKTCKGIYRAFLNAARCDLWNRQERAAAYFMSAEDLTTQAGVSVQQYLALASLLGLGHVELNGHHYVNGMAELPGAEQRAFLAAHPDLYGDDGGTVRLRVAKGRVAIGSLACIGFAAGAEPDWTAMREHTIASLDKVAPPT